MLFAIPPVFLMFETIQVFRPSPAEPLEQGQVSGASVEQISSKAATLSHVAHMHKYFKSTFIFVLFFAVFVRILQIVNFL